MREAALLLTASVFAAAAAQAGTFKTVYEFGAQANDARSPDAPFVARNGLLYGTSELGGPQTYGTVFTFNPTTATVTVLATAVGSVPTEPVTYSDGFWYGTSLATDQSSQIFSVNAKTNVATIVYPFGDNVVPQAMLALGGQLYGSTMFGGASGNGSVFAFAPNTATLTTLYSFTGGADGKSPQDLVLQAGLFYGETIGGGANGAGTIFSIDPATGAITTLYSFTGGQDGGSPSGITFYQGLIYGVASTGGAAGGGTVFVLNPSTAQLTTLYAFPSPNVGNCGPSTAPVVAGGRVYGITVSCGYGRYKGSLFAVDIKSGRKTILHQFKKGPDGVEPFGGLMLYKGVIYGTTTAGGTYDDGTIFTYTP